MVTNVLSSVVMETGCKLPASQIKTDSHYKFNILYKIEKCDQRADGILERISVNPILEECSTLERFVFQNKPVSI